MTNAVREDRRGTSVRLAGVDLVATDTLTQRHQNARDETLLNKPFAVTCQCCKNGWQVIKRLHRASAPNREHDAQWFKPITTG